MVSVEGTKIEVKYFAFLEKYKSEIGINPIIKIETLRRIDTKSDPLSVLDLLDEYVRLQDESLINQIAGLSNLVDSVGLDKIKIYLEDKTLLNRADILIIKNGIELAKYDVEYRKYLKEIGNTGDVFAIVIDTEGKDNESRTNTNIENVINICKDKGYKCFLSNPCFEFFLLLHTYNPIKEYEENKNNFINNPTASVKHTYVRKLLSEHHGHGKKFTKKIFEEKYLKNINQALLLYYKEWAHELDTVKDNVGSNVIELFDLVSNQDYLSKNPK